MRIAIVATAGESLVKFRGPLIKEWVKRGHEVVAVSIESKSEMEEAIRGLGAEYYQVPGNRTGTSILDGLGMIKKYKDAFEDIKPDICFLYMSKPVAFGGIAAKLCGIQHIFVFQTGLEIAFYSAGLKNYFLRFVLRLLYKNVHRYCEKIFFMNHEDERRMLEWKLLKKEQAYYVDGSGVDMTRFVRQDLPETPVVLMVARLVWSKGIREYLEAAAIVKKKFPEARFMLVGGLDENSEALSKSELDSIVEQGVIEYKGYQNDVRPFLKECSVFVLPSYHEGKGTAILEAQAVGRAIVTTDAPGCSETVIDGYNGYIVPLKNGRALAEAIEKLVQSPEKRKEMADNAYLHCKKTFASEIICNEICSQMKV